MKLDDIIASARIIATAGDSYPFVVRFAQGVLEHHEGHAGKLRAELLELAKKWRSTTCSANRGNDFACEGTEHDAACPLGALENDICAAVDALAIAEHEEAKRG